MRDTTKEDITYQEGTEVTLEIQRQQDKNAESKVTQKGGKSRLLKGNAIGRYGISRPSCCSPTRRNIL